MKSNKEISEQIFEEFYQKNGPMYQHDGMLQGRDYFSLFLKYATQKNILPQLSQKIYQAVTEHLTDNSSMSRKTESLDIFANAAHLLTNEDLAKYLQNYSQDLYHGRGYSVGSYSEMLRGRIQNKFLKSEHFLPLLLSKDIINNLINGASGPLTATSVNKGVVAVKMEQLAEGVALLGYANNTTLRSLPHLDKAFWELVTNTVKKNPNIQQKDPSTPIPNTPSAASVATTSSSNAVSAAAGSSDSKSAADSSAKTHAPVLSFAPPALPPTSNPIVQDWKKKLSDNILNDAIDVMQIYKIFTDNPQRVDERNQLLTVLIKNALRIKNEAHRIAIGDYLVTNINYVVPTPESNVKPK